MAQDIREMFKNDKDSRENKLANGHQNRFEDRLEKEFPEKRKANSFLFLKIAAILVVALGLGFFFLKPDKPFNNEPTVADAPTDTVKEERNKNVSSEENNFQLSQISPEFKKIEDYYMASLNIELSKINITPKNKALIDSFMNQMSELDKEYQRLNIEVKETGINEQTLEAMVANLQLRLDLLKKLKNKLKELKQSKKNKYENHKV
jgi:hypothetical protein